MEKKQQGSSHPSAPQWDEPRVQRDLQQGETESEFESEMSELEYDSDMSDSLSSCTNSDSSEAEILIKKLDSEIKEEVSLN